MNEWFKARNVWGAAIESLSDEQAGRLAKAIWTYTMRHEMTQLDGAGKGIFALILMTLAEDEKHTAEISEKRSIASNSRFTNKCQQKISNDIKCNQLISSDDNKNKNKKENKNKNKEQDIYFERFWAAYPRHIAKQSAEKAFSKLNVDEGLLQTILSAIEKQKNCEQWTKDGGQFIPYPSTWLNGHRWEDEDQPSKKIVPIKTVAAQQYAQRDYGDEDADAFARMMNSVKEKT